MQTDTTNNPQHTSNDCASLPHDLSLNDILHEDKFLETYSDKFTPGQWNWIKRNRDKNGLSESGALLRLQNGFHIVVPYFLKWYLSQKA